MDQERQTRLGGLCFWSSMPLWHEPELQLSAVLLLQPSPVRSVQAARILAEAALCEVLQEERWTMAPLVEFVSGKVQQPVQPGQKLLALW